MEQIYGFCLTKFLIYSKEFVLVLQNGRNMSTHCNPRHIWLVMCCYFSSSAINLMSQRRELGTTNSHVTALFTPVDTKSCTGCKYVTYPPSLEHCKSCITPARCYTIVTAGHRFRTFMHRLPQEDLTVAAPSGVEHHRYIQE